MEYNEEGKKFHGNTKLDIIKRAIATSEKPVYLVVHANSWQNNANSCVDPSSDGVGFPHLLPERSFRNPKMNVIGVEASSDAAIFPYLLARRSFQKPESLAFDGSNKKRTE